MANLTIFNGFILKLLAIFISISKTTHSTSIRGTVYMDTSEDCDSGIRRPNSDIIDGDVFVVKSDIYGKQQMNHRRPAECTVGYNFGDRTMSVSVTEWSCEHPYTEPLLAFYDDCTGQRRNLLTWMNCSDHNLTQVRVVSSSSNCISIYHYRGSRHGGYHFVINVVAGYELLSFPAGGIAAVVISIFVGVMIIAKIVCIVSGYDKRLPDIQFDDNNDQPKHNIYRGTGNPSDGATEPIIRIDNGNGDHSGDGNGYVDGQRQRFFNEPGASTLWQAATDHKALQPHSFSSLRPPDFSSSRPSFSGNNAVDSSGIDMPQEFDYDFLDLPIDLIDDGPRLKRYPSARASSIWRHK